MKSDKKSEEHEEDEQQLEILKAVAQAWHSHSGSSRPTNEHDAYRRNFEAKPSRFKLEAMMSKPFTKRDASERNWDFSQSLLDSYEIVSTAKMLERGLVSDNPFPAGLDNNQSLVHTRRKESKNSLRNFFNRLSSRRFEESDIPHPDND